MLDVACYAAELGEVNDAKEQLWAGQSQQRAVQVDPDDKKTSKDKQNPSPRRSPPPR